MRDEFERALKIISETTCIEEKNIHIRDLWFAGEKLSRAEFKIKGYEGIYHLKLDAITLRYFHDIPVGLIK